MKCATSIPISSGSIEMKFNTVREEIIKDSIIFKPEENKKAEACLRKAMKKFVLFSTRAEDKKIQLQFNYKVIR